MPAPKTRIFTASIPLWMHEQILADSEELGAGTQRHSGSQGIAMLALGVYMALDVDERRKLAQGLRPATLEEELVRQRIDATWPVRAAKALAAMTAQDRERVILSLEETAAAKGGRSAKRR